MKLTKKELNVITNYLRCTNNPYEYEVVCSKNGSYEWLNSRIEVLKNLANKTESEFKLIREYQEKYNNIMIIEISDPLSQNIDSILKEATQ